MVFATPSAATADQGPPPVTIATLPLRLIARGMLKPVSNRFKSPKPEHE
jgi:hypothetical protein